MIIGFEFIYVNIFKKYPLIRSSENLRITLWYFFYIMISDGLKR